MTANENSTATSVDAGIGADVPTGAIARIWHGAVPAEKAEAYLGLMRAVALPDYRRIPGNLAAFTLHRREVDVAHFLMLTFWEPEGAIAAFAGEPIEVAKYYDFDAAFLLEKEAIATHHHVYSR